MTWQLSLPKTITTKSLHEWAEELIHQGVPREVICRFLLNQEDFSTAEYRVKVESHLSNVIIDRNLKGREFEKSGFIMEAINLYEANVNDWAAGNYPYERLRVIYTKQKRYDEAIKVCKSFVRVINYYIDKYGSRDDFIEKRERFIHWIEELEGKKYGKSR